jgi:LacI family transcriptional regulator
MKTRLGAARGQSPGGVLTVMGLYPIMTTAVAESAYILTSTPRPSVSVTIYDIAEEARVSIATVSRVLNDHPRVSDATRRRVFRVAERLGYEPHASAQSLARQATRLIAAVVPMLTSYFFMEVIRGLQDRLAESGYDLLVHASRSVEDVDRSLERALPRGRADGLLLVSTPLTVERALRLARSHAPVVLVDSAHPDFDSVSVDNRRGGYEATRHLLDLGHRRIGLVMPSAASVPAAERRAGYADALAEAGLAVDGALVFAAEGEERHGYTRRAGYEAMRRLLALPERPTAVFVAADVMALGAQYAAREAGVAIPADLALVGFDDVEPSAYVGLTTLRQPMYEMGQLAIEKLLRRLREPETPPSHTTFAPRLVVRESTGRPAPAVPA